jgi:hypothetical protein
MRTMCEKCDDLDKKISRYAEFLRQGLDPVTSERIKEAIKEMQKHKTALHRSRHQLMGPAL